MADNDNDGWSTVPTKQKTSSSSSSTNKSQRTRKQKQQRRHDEYDVVIAPTAATSNTNIETYYTSPFMVLCVGLPGSGKSTFSRSLMKSNPTKFGRINQDELKTRQKCERKVKQMLLLSTSTSSTAIPSSESSSPQSIQQQQQQQQRLCPIIDRCNFDMTQRSTWYRLAEECGAADVDGGTTIPVDVVVFDIPYEVCLRRCEIRKGHETIKSPKQAAGILQQLKSQWKPPSSNNNNNNSDERKRYRSLTIIRTEQEQKECLIRILNQPF